MYEFSLALNDGLPRLCSADFDQEITIIKVEIVSAVHVASGTR